MGSFLFKWDHPASEVYVTGTFDDWAKSVKLDKKEGNLHEKLVNLDKIDEKIYYKFVVDDNWTTDHTAPQEVDHSGNTNNLLLPENITKHTSALAALGSAGIMSGVTPHSTTSQLAAEVPKESTGSSDLPGAFPETPAPETSSFGVNPIPATAGFGNPVQTVPGAAVPHPSTFTGNSINSAVTLDKESYERGASGAAPVLPDVVTPEKDRQGGLFGLPPVGGTMIPESSLPMGAAAGAGSFEKDVSPHIQSAGPNSTTASLAAQVPLEPKASRDVPAMVAESDRQAGFAPEAAANSEAVREKSEVEKELLSKRPVEEPVADDGQTSVERVVSASQEKAGFAPEASANPEAVREKSEMEQELEAKVPREPATSTDTTSEGGISGKAAGLAAGAAATATAAAVGYAATAKSYLPTSVQQSIDNMNSGTSGGAGAGATSGLGDTLSNASATATDSAKGAAGTATATLSNLASNATETVKGAVGAHPAVDAAVPSVVKDSLLASHSAPEAAAVHESVVEKSALEAELLKKVPTENQAGEPAPTASAASTTEAPKPMMKSTEAPLDTNKPLPAVKSTETPLVSSSTTPLATGTASSATGSQPSGLNAPASSLATTPAPAPVTPTKAASSTTATPSQSSMAAAVAAAKPKIDSRDVSPMSGGTRKPEVTTGLASATTPVKSVATPAKGTPGGVSSSGSPAGNGSELGSDKKSKRRSGFFGKIREKLSSHEKK